MNHAEPSLLLLHFCCVNVRTISVYWASSPIKSIWKKKRRHYNGPFLPRNSQFPTWPVNICIFKMEGTEWKWISWWIFRLQQKSHLNKQVYFSLSLFFFSCSLCVLRQPTQPQKALLRIWPHPLPLPAGPSTWPLWPPCGPLTLLGIFSLQKFPFRCSFCLDTYPPTAPFSLPLHLYSKVSFSVRSPPGHLI